MKTLSICFAILLLSGCSKNEPIKNEPTPALRYELVQLGTARRDQYLLDKQTGNMWQPICMVSGKDSGFDCKYSAWMKQEIEEITTTKNEIYSWVEHLEKVKKERK